MALDEDVSDGWKNYDENEQPSKRQRTAPPKRFPQETVLRSGARHRRAGRVPLGSFNHLVGASETAKRSGISFQRCGSERTERIDRSYILITPFKATDADCLRREVDDDKTVFFDRRLHFLDIEAGRRLWAHAAEKRGPAIAVGAERSRHTGLAERSNAVVRRMRVSPMA